MDKPESFGKYLRQEREARGVSREEISKSTKISRTVIEALESDDYRFLPEDTFIRGYVRAYARELNLPSEDVVRKFRSFREDLEKKEKESQREREFSQPVRDSSTRRVKVIAIIVLAFGAVVAWLMVSILKGVPPRVAEELEKKPERGSVISPSPVSLPVEPAVTLEVPPVPEQPSPPPSPPEDRGVPLVLLAREEVWVKYNIDGGVTHEILLKPGESYRIRGELSFDLLIGNAGGIELVFNGKPFPALGPSGRVVHLRLPVKRTKN